MNTHLSPRVTRSKRTWVEIYIPTRRVWFEFRCPEDATPSVSTLSETWRGTDACILEEPIRFSASEIQNIRKLAAQGIVEARKRTPTPSWWSAVQLSFSFN